MRFMSQVSVFPQFGMRRLKALAIAGVAFALSGVFLSGCGGGGSSNTSTPPLPSATSPIFAPAGGTYTSAQSVTLSDATSGATIYYTIDGSQPSTASTKYSTAISVAATTTVNALAVASGYSNSAVASATYTINLPAAATPTFSPAGGTYTSAQSVTLSDATSGATIYYTIDGSQPSTASTKYSTAISVAATTTVNALAVASGYSNSAVSSATYTINLPAAATPTFSPAAGTFTSAQSVTLADATPGATIYYTVDNSTPTTSSLKYTAAISVATTTTIKAIAVASGFSSSAVASGTFTINLPAAAAPTFSPAAGTFTAAQSVTLSDTTPAATIYYTVDGSMPTTASTKYAGAISVGSTTTINAIAIATGYSTSAEASATYTINLPAAAAPTFSPAAGTFTTVQSVTLSDATPGAIIYYTTDGTQPTTASTKYTTAISVGASTTINAVAAASGYSNSAVASATYTINLPTLAVNVVLSTHDQTQLLAPQTSLTFGNSAAATNQLLIDENQQYQSIEGFGASFTDSAGYVLEVEGQPSQLTSTLSDLFTRSGNGIGLSFMRNPMGASDLARTAYSFDDQPSGSTDTSLSGFSIAHDQSYILPLVLSAKKLNPQIKLMANPWSPPGWMKSSGSLEAGGLETAYFTSFANYFVKYLQAYQSAGALPDYISLQNEPLIQPSTYPSMYMDPPTQTIVMRDYVLPALKTANLPTKIFVYDHNWDSPSYPSAVLSDPTLLASPQIAGVAWHGYAGPVGSQQTLQNQYPTKGQWQTEHSGGGFISDQFTSDFNEITLVLRNAGKSYVKWSLALDQNMGPNLSQLGGTYGGCNNCSPIVTVNSNTGAITKTIEYYTLGQFSKYILPGAVRVWSSNTPYIVSSAFVNPDGTRVLVAFNNATTPQSVQVQWGTQNFTYSMPAQAAATFVWAGTQNGVPQINPTQQIQGASYSSETGLETENCSDTTGIYDLGYVNDGATATYNNVNFGTGVSQVSVRTASAGNGGTLEFHLDSATGTLLGTAKLPVTGGYQTWQTVTAPITGATGVHTLVLVIHGSGGIANLNWFQFQ